MLILLAVACWPMQDARTGTFFQPNTLPQYWVHRTGGGKICGWRDMLTQATVLLSPQVLSRPLLEQYYMDAYDAVRKHSPGCFVIFAPRQWETDGLEWNTFMSGAPYTKVLQDIHRCG